MSSQKTFIQIYLIFPFQNANAREDVATTNNRTTRFWTTRKTDDRPGVKADRGCQGNSRSRWTTSGFRRPSSNLARATRGVRVRVRLSPFPACWSDRIGSDRRNERARIRSVAQPRMLSSPRPIGRTMSRRCARERTSGKMERGEIRWATRV